MANQDDSPSALRNTVSEQDLASIEKLWRANVVITPQRVQQHHSLLDKQDKVQYSVAAIQQALDRLNANSVKGRPTAENRAAKAALPDAQSQQAIPSPAMGSSETSPPSLQVGVEFEHDIVLQFDISPNILLEDFKTQIRVALELESDDMRRMRVGHAASNGRWIFMHSDAVWRAALRDNIRSFQLRLVASSAASSASGASTVSSAAQPNRLSFEQDGRLQAQKQWEYETKLRSHIRTGCQRNWPMTAI
jgi:hypothetical protein